MFNPSPETPIISIADAGGPPQASEVILHSIYHSINPPAIPD